MKLNVAVLFGGKSVEHEVSIISGLQAFKNIDTEKYNVFPVYITKKNEFYIGEGFDDIKNFTDIDSLLEKGTRVILVNDNGVCKFTSLESKGLFGKKVEREVDLALPVVHGTNEEDGALQGYLKTVGLPFAGCDVTASAVGMDKYVQKALLKENDIPVLPAMLFNLGDYANLDNMVSRIEEKIGYPVIIKPVDLGSSVGISVAKDRASLVDSLDDAFLYAGRVLCEHAITNLREINCAVLGNEVEAMASEIEEPMHTEEILSYEDKYMGNGSKSGAKDGGSKGMASLARQIPANVPAELRDRIRDLAVRSFQVMGCNGVSRIDFMIDADTNELYFNEINTIPGSLAFYLFEPIGIPYKELLDRIIDLAEERKRKEQEITYSFDTNILKNASLGGSKGSKA
ncbi:MAG: D-alanine--D-alanine ligase [Lachnospiraceae bacterium]|nr:D-alanine--D-alanine ligase [Lachnospiraceae bacterium]